MTLKELHKAIGQVLIEYETLADNQVDIDFDSNDDVGGYYHLTIVDITRSFTVPTQIKLHATEI